MASLVSDAGSRKRTEPRPSPDSVNPLASLSVAGNLCIPSHKRIAYGHQHMVKLSTSFDCRPELE
ncbi:MAG: hypothetical protein ACR2KZ_19020 [Segetibacter sp.]